MSRGSATALVSALALDAVAGDPARLHPVAGFGRTASSLERRVWRDCRRRGLLHTALLVLGAAASVHAVERRLGDRRRRLAFAALVLWSTLGGRSLERCALELERAVSAGDLERARALAPRLVGRDPAQLDRAELCRAAVESVAENTTDAVVAPLCWFAVLGAPAAAAYRAANTLDAMVGHRSPRYLRFGWAAARLDDVLTWPWARLATALAVVLAPVVGGDPRRALQALPAARRHPSPNAGLIEAAFAGALAVRLGGRNSYGGRVEYRPAFGGSRAAEPVDIERAVRLSRAVAVATAAAAAVAVAVRP